MLFIFFLAIAGNCLWLYEIVMIKGWHGLNWISKGLLYSPYLITLSFVFAYIIPFIFTKYISIKKSFFIIFILYVISAFYFEVAVNVNCSFLFGRCPRTLFNSNRIFFLLFLPSIFILPFFGRIYWYITNRFIKKNKKSNRHIILILSLLTIPSSLLTIQMNSGYSSGKDWIDAIKMGYPIFWITMFIGLSGIIIACQSEID